MSSPQTRQIFFNHNSSVGSDDSLIVIQETLNNNQRKLRRIHNIKVLLDKKYISAKQAIFETMNSIRDEFIRELDDTLNNKLESLEELEKSILNQCSKLRKSINKPSNAGKVFKQIEESSVPPIVHLLSFLSLDFVANDWNKIRNSLGYIKCSPTKPDDLKLVITNDAFQIGKELQVLVTGERPWYPLLVNSLAGYIEDSHGNKQKGIMKDNGDSDYLFTFTLDNYGIFTISITLYGRHIDNSPATFEFVCPKENVENKNANMFNGAGDQNQKLSSEKMNKFFFTHSSPPPLIEENRNMADTEQANDMGKQMPSKNSVRDSEETSEDSEKDGVGIIKADLIGTVNYQNGVGLHFPIGVAVTPRDDIIICDTGHHLIWIVDKTGFPKKIIKGKGHSTVLARPSAVSLLKDGNFVIKDNNGLHIYDPNGVYIRGIGIGILSRPFGLTVTEDDKIITLNETHTPTLYIFSKEGQVESNSRFEPLINRPPNSKCRFMAAYHKELVVSDLGLSKMYKTTLDGKTIFAFGQYGKREGHMIEPSGIAIDPKGTMLIGDSKNDRVQIFDWNGEFLGVLHFSHTIRRPSDITMTKDGRLFVLNYLDHYLGVYRLSHQ